MFRNEGRLNDGSSTLFRNDGRLNDASTAFRAAFAVAESRAREFRENEKLENSEFENGEKNEEELEPVETQIEEEEEEKEKELEADRMKSNGKNVLKLIENTIRHFRLNKDIVRDIIVGHFLLLN